jgi:glycosyl-4,4'-diaponeurosporenoate acyltransferase
MFLKIPDIYIAVLNIISWPFIMVSVSYLILKVDWKKFNPESSLFKKRMFERDGRLYEKMFFVKKWKGLLPDGAAWFKGGFQKKNLKSREPEYLKRFAHESCRGEMSHLISLCFIPVFYIYNPLWAAIIMSICGLLANFPCIIVQRFNRIQLLRIYDLSRKRSMVI